MGVSVLLFQLAAVVYARFVPSRYFCWAPYDAQNQYAIRVEIEGRELSDAELRERYRRAPRGFDNRSIQHVIDILQGYEERYGANDHAQVEMRYRINGAEEQRWNWPPQP